MKTPDEAAQIVGVPAVQLLRWAYIGQGPRNSGTKRKPMFDEEDLERWLDQRFQIHHGYERVNIRRSDA